MNEKDEPVYIKVNLYAQSSDADLEHLL